MTTLANTPIRPLPMPARGFRFLIFGLFFMAGLLTGCHTGPPPLAAGGEVRNLLPGIALEVRAVHQPTGFTAGVTEILPGRRFLLSFPTREMRSKSVTLTWRTATGESYSRELDIPAPPAELRDEVLWVVYSLLPDGQAKVELERASRSEMGY